MAAKHPEQAKLDEIIERKIAAHERGLQTSIGPSEFGTPCDSRLARTLAELPEVNLDPAKDWRPTVGTAVHAWLDDAIVRENRRRHRLREPEPYRAELALAVGTIAPGVTVHGHLDLYDGAWPGIVDWKIVGVTTLRKVKAYGVGPAYRAQVHTYGRGVARGLKLPVEHVACYFLPNNGTLRDAYFWTEAYDPEYADQVINRVRRIKAEVDRNPQIAVHSAALTFDNCGYCPYYVPHAPQAKWKICPGAPDMEIRSDSELDGLL